MSLATYFGQLRRYLLEGGEPGPLLSRDPHRIEVYSNAYSILRESVLGSLFPRLKGSLTPERWVALRDGYFHAHPPAAWEINANAALFPEFVAEASDLPAYAGQLADYEWTDFLLSMASDEVAPGGPLRLNPTLTLKELAWDLPSWMHLPLPANPPVPTPVTALMYRHPVHERTWCRSASPESLLALKLVAEEVAPDAFEATTGVPSEVVRGHVRRGLEEGWLLGSLV